MSCIAESTVSSCWDRSVGDQLERLLLAADVERARRLVEQEQRRLLGERAAEHDALLLAAAQRLRGGGARSSRGRAARAPAPRRLEVAGALVAERAHVGRPAEQHVLVDAHPGRQQGRLRDEREPPGDRAPAAGSRPRRRRGGSSPSSGRDRQRRAAACSCRRRSGRSAPPIRRGRPRPRPRRARVARAELDRSRVERERRHENVLLVRSTIAKNGAPKNAVTTPIGSSAGETIVRASTSASTRNPPPTSSESGRTIR